VPVQSGMFIGGLLHVQSGGPSQVQISLGPGTRRTQVETHATQPHESAHPLLPTDCGGWPDPGGGGGRPDRTGSVVLQYIPDCDSVHVPCIIVSDNCARGDQC